MARIRAKNTKPELAVRRLVHAMGYRFRLHARNLPGSPDIVFPARRKVLFVHGCFWHSHEGCPRAFVPKSSAKFWRRKLTNNKTRDARNLEALHAEGWDARVVWECELADPKLAAGLKRFLGRHRKRR